MDLDRLPTERQYGESRKAHQAFRVWLSLRSIRSAAQELSKSRQLLERWSVRWGWVQRAEAANRERNRRVRSVEHLETGVPPSGGAGRPTGAVGGKAGLAMRGARSVQQKCSRCTAAYRL